jgi:hypothetical protein
MCNHGKREQLRAVLIKTYFAPEIRMKLLEQGHLNYAAYQYSEKLLKVAEWKKQFEKPEDEPEWQKKYGTVAFAEPLSICINTAAPFAASVCSPRKATPSSMLLM